MSLLSVGTFTNTLSGNIGVLAVLVGIVAMLCLLNVLDIDPLVRLIAASSGNGSNLPGEPRVLKVPWSRSTSKNPVFAALIGGRLKFLDFTPLYDDLARRPSPRRLRPIDVQLPDVAIRFYPVTNDVYCYRFRLADGAGEPLEEARLSDSAWARARKRYDGTRYFYFFWVSGDSFQDFREVRDRMRSEGVEVGWKPVRSGVSLELCQGLDGGGSLVPQ